MIGPQLQEFRARRFHDLKTTSSAGIHPACVVGNAAWEHPAFLSEAFADQGGATRLELLNDHEEHGPQFITPWGRAKPWR